MTLGLGIDPNTTRAGMYLLNGGRVEMLFTVKAKPLKRHIKTLQVGEEMGKLIAAQIYGLHPDWIAIEGAFMGLNRQTSLKIAVLVGMIAGVGVDSGAHVMVIPTASIDKLCGTSGGPGGHKRKVRLDTFAYRSLPEETYNKMDEHQVDAYAVGEAGRALYQEYLLLQERKD